MARSDAAVKRALAKIDAARARTIATPLAGSDREAATSPEPLTRPAYALVRLAASGREYLDMCALFNSQESAQNSINERQRINARALTLGTMDPYVRVAVVEIREQEEGS